VIWQLILEACAGCNSFYVWTAIAEAEALSLLQHCLQTYTLKNEACNGIPNVL